MNYLDNQQITELIPAAGSLVPMAGVSSRYNFIPTIAAVDLLRDCGWFPVTARQSRVNKDERDGFQRHSIRFVKEGLEWGQGERVDLVLYNSHDRGTAFKLAASVWRKICGNGLMVPSEFANFSHKHIGFNQADFVESANSIAESASMIAGSVNDMKAIEMTPDERGIYAQAAHSLIYDEIQSAPIQPDTLLREHRLDDQGNDLWTTFNVVQENIIKGGIRGSKYDEFGRRRKVTTRPIKSLEKDIKINQALWLLTEKMAELIKK